MLASLWNTPAAMVQHPRLFLGVWVLGLIQGLITLFGEDGLLEWIGGAFFIDPTQTVDGFLFLQGVIWANLLVGLMVLTYAWVARGIAGKQSPSAQQMGSSALALGVVILLVGGATILVIRGILSIIAAGGIFFYLGTALFIAALILMMFAFVKLSFSPTAIGYGFSPKDALAESWNQTSGHFVSVIILLLVTGLVGTIVQSIGFFLPPIENEWIQLVIDVTLGSIGAFYGTTVFALALPARPTSGNSGLLRHPHKK